MAETRKTRPVSWINAALRDFQEFPESATAIREGNLHHAGTETVQGFGNVRLSVFRGDRERTQE